MTDATPDFESLGPIPEPSAENGVLTVDDGPPSSEQESGALEAAVTKMEEDEAAAEAKAEIDQTEAAAEVDTEEFGEGLVPVTVKSAAEAKAEFEAALGAFNQESDVAEG